MLDEAAQTVTGPAAAWSAVSLLCGKRAKSGLYGRNRGRYCSLLDTCWGVGGATPTLTALHGNGCEVVPLSAVPSSLHSGRWRGVKRLAYWCHELSLSESLVVLGPKGWLCSSLGAKITG